MQYYIFLPIMPFKGTVDENDGLALLTKMAALTFIIDMNDFWPYFRIASDHIRSLMLK
jgi:hypothetical protein